VNDTKEKKRTTHFWTTFVGALAGTATVITAMAVLILALHAAGVISPSIPVFRALPPSPEHPPLGLTATPYPTQAPTAPLDQDIAKMHMEIDFRLREIRSFLDQEPMTKGNLANATRRSQARGVGISERYKDTQLRTLLFELELAAPEETQHCIQNTRNLFEALAQLAPEAPYSEGTPADPQKVQLARDQFAEIESEWQRCIGAHASRGRSGTASEPVARSISILVDDFLPQPYQGAPVYYYNRLGGDRGAINDSILDWGMGQVTTTISPGNSWGGVWMSLNHPIREGLPVDFSAILPSQISPAYQSQIMGITVRVAQGTPGKILKLELKYGDELRWMDELTLEGGQQVVGLKLPALGNVNHLVWVLDRASAGDSVVLDSVSFTATTQITDAATAAFVWSYGMLLNNWNLTTGLVRDKAKDASGEFDAIQATGSLAAATALAQQLGIVERADAIQIVNRISDTLLLDLPRHKGLWPHWVEASPAGEITILENTEWSSVDTVIAAIGLLAAQSGLGLDTSGTEQMLQAIDWDDLVTPEGILHGYTYTGELLPFAWDTFGGESWLVALAYAGATGRVAPLEYPSPPTANGSGFIDELAWLFVPPPSEHDYWGTDWAVYRAEAADTQLLYYPSHYPESCFTQLGLFGLSAAEVPDPSLLPQANIYQAFGVGGRFAPANDGSTLLGAPVVVPHYAAMISSLRPEEAIEMWDWLIKYGHFSPLSNIESLMFPVNSDCEPGTLVWNQLKGSWNLSLQTLGWGCYLAELSGQVPILWQATTASPILRRGYKVLVPRDATPPTTPTPASAETAGTSPTAESPVPIAIYVPQPHETPTTPIWENTEVPCAGRPVYLWFSPGRYLYKGIMRNSDTFHADISKLIDSGAIRVVCGAPGGGGTFVEPH
jgi:hypothetical protein